MNMHPRGRSTSAAVLALTLALTACGGDGESTDETTTDDATADPAAETETATGDETSALAATTEEACEAGREEGVVRYWASGNDLFQEQIAPFLEQYPEIDVQFFEVGGDDATQRLLAEQQAGREPTADVLEGEPLELGAFYDAGLVEEIDWTTYGARDGQLGRNGGVRTIRSLIGVAWNTDEWSEDQIPDTYAELAEFPGVVNFDPRGDRLAALATDEAMGLEDAKAWFDAFFENGAMPVRGSTASGQSVASGETDVTTSALIHNIEALADEGAPLEMKYLDVVQTNDTYGYVVTDSPNMNAAVCFMSWWASEDGGVEQRRLTEGKTNFDRAEDVPEGSVLVDISTPENVDAALEFAEYISGIAGGEES